jgi:DNA-binding NarL/FixJ family response regulator
MSSNVSTVRVVVRETVATHVRNLLTETGTATRTEAAADVLRRGLRAK